jgi:hypothetical protein
MYTSELLDWYTKEEWDIIDLFIDHAKEKNPTPLQPLHNWLKSI